MRSSREPVVVCCLLALAAVVASASSELDAARDRHAAQQPLGGVIEVCVFGGVDVPTTESSSNTTLSPDQIFQYDGDPPTYTTVLTVPGSPHLAGIFKLDAAGGWLISVEAPSDLGGALSSTAQPRDIIRRDGNDDYSLFFCGADVTGTVPQTSQLDAFWLAGGDNGDLIVSFDVPTTVGATVFDPSDMVRYEPTGAGTCAAWQLAVVNPVFDASAAGDGITRASNAVGASRYAGLQVLSPDIPTTFSPPGLTVVPGQLVAWNGAQYSLFATLEGWPISSNLHGVAGPGNPGRVGGSVQVDKAATPGFVTLSWAPSCSDNAGDYAVYEGALGDWNSHVPRTCTDEGGDLSEQLQPGSGDRYFLVVPTNPQGEGSYGLTSSLTERPASSAPCRTWRIISTCPQ